MFITRPRTGSFVLSFKRPLRKKRAAAPESRTKAPAPACGPDKQSNKQPGRQQRLARARAQVRRECADILNKCAVFGRMDMAAALIRSGEGAVVAHKRLLAARNEKLRASQKDGRINNRLAAVSETRSGRLVENMKRRLAAQGVSNG